MFSLIFELSIACYLFQTRMQTLIPDSRAVYRNVFEALGQIFRTEGFRSAMRGVDATAYGAGPAHAVYFAMYEYLKIILSHNDKNNHLAHGNLFQLYRFKVDVTLEFLKIDN